MSGGSDDGNSVSFGDRLPYARSALLYFELGWGPLPVTGKGKGTGNGPPRGKTGRSGTAPQRNEVEYWATAKSDLNVALRLPEGVVGVDVDAYNGKRGRETLAELESARGPLPETWVSGSRDDGVSGIRFYAVPASWEAPGIFGAGIEGISWHYRYAVAWPSIHPETGLQYKWRRLPDWEPCSPPRVSELPALPESWLTGWRRQHDGTGNSINASGEEPVDIDGMIENGAGPDGSQRHSLLRLALKMAGLGWTEARSLAIWRAVIAATAEVNAADPWTDDHFYEFFRSAQEKTDFSRRERQLPTPSAALVNWAEQITASAAVPAVNHSAAVSDVIEPNAIMNTADDAEDDDSNDEDDAAGNDGNDDGRFIVSLEQLGREYTCDHFGMAEFFIDTCGSLIRWDEKAQVFMVYFPGMGRWHQDGKKHEQVARMVRALAKAVHEAAEESITEQDIADLGGQDRQLREAAERRVNALRRWYHVFKGTGNMYSIIGAIQPTAISCHAGEFNRGSHLLNFTSGTYDVTTGVLRSHSQADLLTHQIKTPFNPALAERPLEEAAPHFSRLLKRICAAPGEVPAHIAESRQRAIESWLGYQLHGSNPEKLMGVLQGASQIGKNQIIEVIGALLGNELSWLSARPQLLVKAKGDRHDAEESSLAGMRMVLVNELVDSQFLDESQVLRFVNPEGSQVGLRLMRQDRVDVPVTWKITVTTNALPRADVTPQIANRLLILQLSEVEVPAAERYDIKREILENEAEAVLAHLVSWWRAWYLRWSERGSETGLLIPDEATLAIEEYREENKPPAVMFIEECLVIEPSAYIASKDVWEYCDRYYRIQHSDKDRRYLGGRRKLYEMLDELPGVSRFTRPKGGKDLLLGFQGVRLVDDVEEGLRLLEARGSGRLEG